MPEGDAPHPERRAALTFTFRPDVDPDRQDQLMAEVRSWQGVDDARPLNPQAKHPLGRRIAYAYLSDPAAAADVLARLRRLGEVESASEPARRTLQ